MAQDPAARHTTMKAEARQSSWNPWTSRAVTISAFATFAVALFLNSPLSNDQNMFGADAGLIRGQAPPKGNALLDSRANSPTDVCTRWAQQATIVNGTIYIYGGQATTSAGQTQNTWNNNFLTLDATKSWQIASPSLSGLPQPSGPPAVALGTLWNSYNSLFLYGGEYSWQPVVSPSPYALWEYDILSSSWTEHNSPETSAGVNSDPRNQPVQNAAEGAGISIPELGRGFYFGGHLDGYTTAGWSQSTARVYLKSLTEFTFPGYENTAVQALSSGQQARSDGVWRNITQGGLQDTAGFPERADGVLVYVPGYGTDGLILGLAGGTNTTFSELNEIDVYDIANSTWYKQATSGTTPQIRVNPCAVAASAPDGSSTNIYMYGGQNLQPAGEQIQYSDMYVLSVPSFTWINVTANASNPPGRSGHTCHIWDSQMIVLGGYVGTEISCDSPGIYVFNTTSLEWQNQFTALSGSDTQNQQLSQEGSDSGLSGSYGYQVPEAVYSVIGGGAEGGATLTAPVATASDGPLATGTPITYSVPGLQTSVYVTVSDGHTITGTATLVPVVATGVASSANSSGDSSSNSGAKIGAIVAGVVAFLLVLVIIYLVICLVIYRRQLQLYKNHVAVAQRASENPNGRNGIAANSDSGAAAASANEKASFLAPSASAGAVSSDAARSSHQDDQRVGSSGRGSSSRRQSIEAWSRQNTEAMPPLPADRRDLAYRGRSGSDSGSASSEDWLMKNEPTFFGVMLHPRRSLKIVNK